MGLVQSTNFVHLHCHSAYSLLEGTATLDALVSAAKKLKMPALALTDRNNLYGAVHFYMRAQKAGIKPIIGMEVDLDDGSSLVLLARNFDGYRNLCHLATVLRLNADPEGFAPAGFDDEEDEIPAWEPGVWGVPVFGFTGKTGKPSSFSGVTPVTSAPKQARLPRELLLSGRHARGLIALSGGRHGLVNSLVMKGKVKQAARAAGMLLSAFGEGNFFIEIQSINERDVAIMPQLAEIASDLGIPIVATNDVLYLDTDSSSTALALAAARNRIRGLHKTQLSVSLDGSNQLHGDGDTELQEEVGTERYFKSGEQMAELFHKYPQAIANTHFIAEQCNLELPLHKPLFPSVDLQANETPFSRLWKLCFAGATRRYRPLTGQVISRLKYELEIIEALGFSAYFLVVYDIAHFAHSRDIPIMARGSAANSLVAFVLGITQVDPLAHDLLFERFLSPSRAEFELPDIDLDLCWRRRDEVLHYVYEKYKRDHVAIVGTHITFRLRSAWREMAKVMGISPERISRVAARLPYVGDDSDVFGELDENEQAEIEEITGDASNADDTNDTGDIPNLKFKDATGRAAFELAKAIKGLPRHAGMHCAGVVITPGHIPIADIVPLQRAARDASMSITQYEKDAIEAMGLVKMDLLGSRALTTLVDALQSSGLATGHGDVPHALEAIPFDDERTYRMMAEGDTLGCFQLESPGMRGLLKWLRPRNLNDIAVAISLFRPGPLEGGFLDMFMRRHLQQEPVTYSHPLMEPILRDTRGVILYQEQFLKLAHSLAGMDLGEAEKLRKELGKSHSSEERTRLGGWFVAGAIERGIDQLQAEKVWEVIAGYSGFGFCKAHACSYALTAYRSAYMKAHYPAHYLTAQINNQGGYYGTTVYVEDARRLHVELLPPHVNESGALCEVSLHGHSTSHNSRAIRFGLQFVKGLSERTISALLTARCNNGPFRSLLELMSRVEMSGAEITSLVKVGACDGLGAHTGELGIPSIAPLHGRMGESLGAVRELPALNRKQMMWLLPSLLSGLSGRNATAKGAMRSAISTISAMSLDLKATGTDHEAIQILMGEVAHHSDSPKILGKSILQLDVPDIEDYTPLAKLRLEQEVLGFGLSHNEMELHKGIAEAEGAIPSRKLARYAGREVTIAGTAAAGRRHMSKVGEWMLFLTLQDHEGLIEVVLFPDTYKKSVELLANSGHGPYLITGQVQVSGKGRGIGIQPPADLVPTDAIEIKMHPVIIATEVKPLSPNATYPS